VLKNLASQQTTPIKTKKDLAVRTLYPEITPYNDFMLTVSEHHQLYVEQCGNPDGQPVVFLHGGPGAGCSTNDRRFFNPDKYRIILFDQRGCGRSKPHGSLEENHTQALVADIEKIRQHLAIERWHVFGGSWGSTLSLAYAQAHPKHVVSLTLRGIYLARPQDTEWAFNNGGGTRIFADYWQEYLNALPEGSSHNTVRAAYDVMTGSDREAAERVARAWSEWEIRCCTLEPNQAFVDAATSDESCWTLARHEAHFMVNYCFLSDNQLLNDCHKISHIPTTIIHGRYDIVCPFDNAWLLHQALPNSTLITTIAGHASVEPETAHHLLEATDRNLAL